MVTPHRWRWRRRRRGIRRGAHLSRSALGATTWIGGGRRLRRRLVLTPSPPDQYLFAARRSVWTCARASETVVRRLTGGRPTETADDYTARVVGVAAIARTRTRALPREYTITAPSPRQRAKEAAASAAVAQVRGPWWGRRRWWCERCTHTDAREHV